MLHMNQLPAMFADREMMMQRLFIGGLSVVLVGCIILSAFVGGALFFVVVGCIILSTFIFLRNKMAKQQCQQKSLPSPPKVLPTWFGKFGGHMLLLKRGKVPQQLEGWADEFEGQYELFLFGTRRIVVVDPDENRRILSRRPAGFGRGPNSTDLEWAGRAVGMCPGLFTQDGLDWGRSRRLIAPAFSPHNVRIMVPAIAKVAESVCAKWAVAADGDGIVDAKDNLGRYAHDVIALVGFRHEAKAVSATGEGSCPTFCAVEKILVKYRAILMSPILRFSYYFIPFHPWVRALEKEKADVENLVKDLCEKERRQIAHEKGRTSPSSPTVITTGISEASEGMILRKLVEAGVGGSSSGGGGGEGPPSAILDEEIVTQCRSLFLAGQETTSQTLSWCVYFLAKYPRVLARCCREAMEHISSSDGLANTFEETTGLAYTAAVFKEVLRLKGTVPVLTFFAKEPHTMLDGTVYPKGTAFAIMLRYMSTREKYFTRAKEFIPERWIEAEREEVLLGTKMTGSPEGAESNVTRAVNHVEDAFFPFGSGPRVCPGQGMANLEGVIICAALCVQFDIALAPEQEDPPKDRAAITSGPADMKLKLTKRQVS